MLLWRGEDPSADSPRRASGMAVDVTESMRSRAWRDAERVVHTLRWLLATLVLDAIVGVICAEAVVTATRPSVRYGLVTAIGLVGGTILSLGLVLLFQLIRAPFRQRTEAREEVQRLRGQATGAQATVAALLGRVERERRQLPIDDDPVTDDELSLAKATLTETRDLVDGTYPQHVHTLGVERIGQIGRRDEDQAGHSHAGMRDRYRWAIVTLDNVLKDLRSEGDGA